MLQGASVEQDVNLHNNDGGLGRLLVASSISFTLATEDMAVVSSIDATLSAIKAQTDKFAFIGDQLKVIGDLSLTSVGIEDAADARINPATKEEQVVAQGKLDTINGTIATMSGKLPASVGQKVMAASFAVVIASDQSAVPASQSGTWHIANITGTVSLPTGAATDATLAAISAKLPATLGQSVMANSLTVTIASNQSALQVAQNGTWNITNITGTVSLPTGASTEATLAAMSAKLPATLGQKTMANSFAVTIASDQSAVPASQSGTWHIGNITGTVSLPTGAATEATLAGIKAKTDALTLVTDRLKTMPDDFTGYDSVSAVTASLATNATANSDTVVPNGEVWHIIGVSFSREFTMNPRRVASRLNVIWDPTTANKTLAALRCQGNTESADIKYKVTGDGVKVIRLAFLNGSEDASVHEAVLVYRKA